VGWKAYATMTEGPDKGKKLNAMEQSRNSYMRLQRVESQLAGLVAAVESLSKLVAEGHDDLTVEQLLAEVKTQIDTSIKNATVKVDVTVADETGSDN
jgi:hypothetical protein